LCFIYPLVAAILVYLHHNANALAVLQINVRELLPIDASFFRTFVEVQSAFAFIMAVLVAPPLISRDLSNNALPLYLCRPLSRAEYVLGKMAVVVFLLSLVTWVPGFLLFFFQASLAGFGWLWSNLWMLGAIFSGCMVWIVLLALLALAVSSLVKWRVVASGALLGLFFVPSAFGAIVNELFLTRAGHLISLWATMDSIRRGLFGLFVRQTGSIRGKVSHPIYDGQYMDIALLEPPLWASWLVVLLVCALCVWLLSRKVRAYEVIK
jgi:ABC-type transport system involved in multi-copper enzyme maturation permease subunit